jgi:hypothetical protein
MHCASLRFSYITITAEKVICLAVIESRPIEGFLISSLTTVFQNFLKHYSNPTVQVSNCGLQVILVHLLAYINNLHVIFLWVS